MPLKSSRPMARLMSFVPRPRHFKWFGWKPFRNESCNRLKIRNWRMRNLSFAMKVWHVMDDWKLWQYNHSSIKPSQQHQQQQGKCHSTRNAPTKTITTMVAAAYPSRWWIRAVEYNDIMLVLSFGWEWRFQIIGNIVVMYSPFYHPRVQSLSFRHYHCP